MEAIDDFELAKNILVLAIPMAMGVIFSDKPLAKSNEMQYVAIALSFAFSLTLTGLLLDRVFPTGSSIIQVFGIALMVATFSVFLACFESSHLRPVPIVFAAITVVILVACAVGFIREVIQGPPAEAPRQQERDESLNS